MFFHFTQVLSTELLQECQTLLADAPWGDGKVTAGSQSALVKNNLQLPESHPITQRLRARVLAAMSDHAQLFSAALPKRIYPPLFNCYRGSTNAFGEHVDNAIRTHPESAQSLRTDLSFTLFLSAPVDYDGGELVIDTGASSQAYKLPAGDMLLYPSYSLHRVNPVRRGQRLACFSWIESLVREPERRAILHDLDNSIINLRARGEDPDTLRLTNCYHNLLRMWAG
jgi:PKHD-type hydroxylase